MSRIGPVDKDEIWTEKIIFSAHISSVYIAKKMALTILLRFNAMADRRHSSVAARMPRFRIFERLCSLFIAAKLPSAQIFRFPHHRDRYSGVLTLKWPSVKRRIAAAGQNSSAATSLVKASLTGSTFPADVFLYLVTTKIFPCGFNCSSGGDIQEAVPLGK